MIQIFLIPDHPIVARIRPMTVLESYPAIHFRGLSNIILSKN